MKINFRTLVLIIAYLMNFFHDIHPHSHSDESHHSKDNFFMTIVDLFSHSHEETKAETDENNDSDYPFPHTHLLQGHTLVQTITTVTINLSIQVYYILPNVSETPIASDVIKRSYLTDKLIFYDSIWRMTMMLRAPPLFFKSCLA